MRSDLKEAIDRLQERDRERDARMAQHVQEAIRERDARMAQHVQEAIRERDAEMAQYVQEAVGKAFKDARTDSFSKGGSPADD